MNATTVLPIQTSVEYFESIYAEAQGDASRVQWADGRANPALVTWLNAVAPSLVRCGARACVIGCGLGDDAKEIIKRGYDVTAFDCSRTAVEWAKNRDAENARAYVQADLFGLPAKWKHRFDLVVEIYTLQSLSPDQHESAMRAIADILSPHGHLLVIARGQTEANKFEDGPPWPLSEEELRHLAGAAGLKIVEPIAIFEDDEDPPVTRMRAMMMRDKA